MELSHRGFWLFKDLLKGRKRSNNNHCEQYWLIGVFDYPILENITVCLCKDLGPVHAHLATARWLNPDWLCCLSLWSISATLEVWISKICSYFTSNCLEMRCSYLSSFFSYVALSNIEMYPYKRGCQNVLCLCWAAEQKRECVGVQWLVCSDFHIF